MGHWNLFWKVASPLNPEAWELLVILWTTQNKVPLCRPGHTASGSGHGPENHGCWRRETTPASCRPPLGGSQEGSIKGDVFSGNVVRSLGPGASTLVGRAGSSGSWPYPFLSAGKEVRWRRAAATKQKRSPMDSWHPLLLAAHGKLLHSPPFCPFYMDSTPPTITSSIQSFTHPQEWPLEATVQWPCLIGLQGAGDGEAQVP